MTEGITLAGQPRQAYLSNNPIFAILLLNLRQVRPNIEQVLSSKLLFHEFREMRGKWKAQAYAVSLRFIPSGLMSS